MATGWSYDNTKMLITTWGQEDVQDNWTEYGELWKVGVEKTWQQCGTKIKKNYL